MYTGKLQTLRHISETFATIDFGIWQNPRTGSLWIADDDYILESGTSMI